MQKIFDRCVVVRETLLSGADIALKSNIENIDWITECAESVEKQVEKKPVNIIQIKGTEAAIGDCPVCGAAIDKSDLYCCKCGQKLTWK